MPDFSVLFDAPPPVPLHAVAAFAAVLAGAVQLSCPKGTLSHKFLGYIWIGLMAVVAVSGLFIHELRVVGPFSPIHILSLFTLVVLYFAVDAARKGDIKSHRRRVVLLYGLALILTGAFTLLPGRIMNQVVFGS